jgi:predicted acyl esterase
MDVNVTPFEIETKTRHGDMVRADVYLPRNSAGPFPVLLGASPYQKSLRHLPPVPDPKGCGTPFRAPRARRFTT